MVCRVTHDADADHSRYPHQSHPVRPIPRQLATYDDDPFDYGNRGGTAIFTAGLVAGFCALAAALLAVAVRHFDLLRRVDSGHQNLVDSQVVGLIEPD